MGHLRVSAECRLDLANFLILNLGWFLRDFAGIFVFSISSVLIGFTNLEVVLNEDILCI